MQYNSQSHKKVTNFRHPVFSGSGSSGLILISSRASCKGISLSDTILVLLTNFHIRYAVITSGISLDCSLRSEKSCGMWKGYGYTYRQEETKKLADQFPLVNTGKPLVNKMIIQKPNAIGVEYTVTRQQMSLKRISELQKLTSPRVMPRQS